MTVADRLRNAARTSNVDVKAYAWPLVLATGGILLYGRYIGWGIADRHAANTSYVLSFFFFAIMLPTVYYLVRMVTLRSKVALAISGAAFVVYTAPYAWLGLDRFRHVDAAVRANEASVPPGFNHIDWFPKAFFTFGFLRDFAILAMTFVIICAVVWWLLRRGLLANAKRARLALALLGGIFIETVLHTGFRSPYTYLAHFQPWNGPSFWYHIFILPAQGLGAVEQDWVWFSMLDNLFKGIAFDQSSNIFMRPFIHYVASPFTYFVDSYDVFLILNPLLWFLGVLCTYDVVHRVSRSWEIARFAAALTACGNGFIYYVAQPMSYLAYYVSVVVLIFAFERIMVREPESFESIGLRRVLLFGSVLGLLSLTYDFLPMYPMLLLYAVFRREPVLKTIASCAVALAIYASYFWVYVDLLRLPDNVVTGAMKESALGNIVAMLTHFQVGNVYVQTVGVITNYVQMLVYGFVIVAFSLAVAGFVQSRMSRTKQFAAIMLVPSALLNVYLYYGGLGAYAGILLISLPRFSYIAWLGIYTAAALALVRIAGPHAGGSGGGEPRRPLRPLLAWGLVAAIAILQNVDSFGLPALTYHFMWPTASVYEDQARH